MGVLLTVADRTVDRFVTKTSKKWILVRHGESVNNLLSQKWDLKQWWKENGMNNKQDPVLSLLGRHQCTRAGKILFGERRDSDPYHLFGDGTAVNYSAVYVSPMRRTLQTALLTFGPAANAAGIPFKALPWAHEARKSKSDVGLGSKLLVQFVRGQAAENGLLFHLTEPLQTLEKTLRQLPDDWSTNASVPDATLPYYPKGNKKESNVDLSNRMQRLKSEMLGIPEDAAILVAHSGVIRWLLSSFVRNRKPDNVAMFYGELSSAGWSNVQLLGGELPGHAPIEGLAGFMPSNKATDCSKGNCDDFDEQFAVLGEAKKCPRGSLSCDDKVFKGGTTYEWVYDKVMKALTYFEVSKNPEEDKAKGTIYLQSHTTVWYTTESMKGSKVPSLDHQLTCDKACPLDDTLNDVTAVIIFTSITQKHEVQDYKCKENGGCFVLLLVEKPDKGEKLPAALKIAIAVACSRNEEKDIADALRTNACEPEDELESYLKSPTSRDRRIAMYKSDIHLTSNSLGGRIRGSTIVVKKKSSLTET